MILNSSSKIVNNKRTISYQLSELKIFGKKNYIFCCRIWEAAKKIRSKMRGVEAGQKNTLI